MEDLIRALRSGSEQDAAKLLETAFRAWLVQALKDPGIAAQVAEAVRRDDYAEGVVMGEPPRLRAI